MKGKKVVILFAALLTPVFVFLFLKFFGRNEFNVPLIHEQAVVAPAGCDFAYAAPYRVPDSLIQRIAGDSRASFFIVNFSRDEGVENRVYNEFGADEVRAVTPVALSGKVALIKTCALLVPDDADVVLVDNERRIRGYYTAAGQEEMDRLIVELKILLKDY